MGEIFFLETLRGLSQNAAKYTSNIRKVFLRKYQTFLNISARKFHFLKYKKFFNLGARMHHSLKYKKFLRCGSF